MIQRFDFNLTEDPDENGFQPFMSACILGGDPWEDVRPAIVICPGGGYHCVCEYWEGERLAMAYAAAGFNAIVVNYTTPVSYTHLRAHETDSYLVCRLLLEKKKKHETTKRGPCAKPNTHKEVEQHPKNMSNYEIGK